MAFGLSFQEEDSMIANNFVIVQVDADDDSEQLLANLNEQERLAMTRVLHDYKTAYETNGSIDLERLFNHLGSVFKQEVRKPQVVSRGRLAPGCNAGSGPNSAKACTSG